jgi:hypothetical protein
MVRLALVLVAVLVVGPWMGASKAVSRYACHRTLKEPDLLDTARLMAEERFDRVSHPLITFDSQSAPGNFMLTS